jgi:cytochrome c-type biogenesis protein CcmH/NrfG
MPEPPADLIAQYRTAVQAEPHNAVAHSNLGWGYYGRREYREAVEAFREALSLDRNLVDAHYGLGLALKESGGGEAATRSFEMVMALAPEQEVDVRGRMLVRLARGHINQINTGDWNLGREARRADN